MGGGRVCTAECKVTMRAHYNAYVGISICTLPCIYIYSNHNIIRRNKNISFYFNFHIIYSETWQKSNTVSELQLHFLQISTIHTFFSLICFFPSSGTEGACMQFDNLCSVPADTIRLCEVVRRRYTISSGFPS